MASSSSRDRVDAFLDALDERDGTALAAMLTEDAAYDDGHGGRTLDRENIRDALIARASSLDERHGDRLFMTSDDGRRVAVEVTLRGTYERSVAGLPEARGQRYSVPACLVFSLNGDKVEGITRYIDFTEWERALRRG